MSLEGTVVSITNWKYEQKTTLCTLWAGKQGDNYKTKARNKNQAEREWGT